MDNEIDKTHLVGVKLHYPEDDMITEKALLLACEVINDYVPSDKMVCPYTLNKHKKCYDLATETAEGHEYCAHPEKCLAQFFKDWIKEGKTWEDLPDEFEDENE